jgi:voltage-gated potassium channel
MSAHWLTSAAWLSVWTPSAIREQDTPKGSDGASEQGIDEQALDALLVVETDERGCVGLGQRLSTCHHDFAMSSCHHGRSGTIAGMDTTTTTPPHADEYGKPDAAWRRRLYRIVFESDTRAGQLFDIIVIAAILLSVAVVIVDSVPTAVQRYGRALSAAEWWFTALFTVEYVARLISVRHQMRYATSFYGIIDLLAVVPTYLAVVWPDAQLLIDVRVLRLLRVFRIFRLTEYMMEYSQLGAALHASRRKILVFLSFVLMVVLVMGTVMHIVEGPEHGFTSIPVSVYWAITTMTTVGFGDLTPATALGRFIASVMMLLGWGVLAVPTGIVTAEMTAQRRPAGVRQASLRCGACQARDHHSGARFCWRCGTSLEARP